MNPNPAAQGFVGRIPVCNLWLLMFYASEFRQSGYAATALEDAPDDIPNLVAAVLSRAVDRLLHRGLLPGFLPTRRDLNRVRGRIDLIRTATHNLLDRGRVACRYEELALNTPRYRHAAAALQHLAAIVTNSDLATTCRALVVKLGHAGILPRRARPAELLRDPVHRHDQEGQIILTASNLAFEILLPTENLGTHPHAAPQREEHWVRKLFEKAVGGFARLHMKSLGCSVACATPHSWQLEAASPGLESLLPTMTTDIKIYHRPSRSLLIVDTKFTAMIQPGYHRDSSLKSGHIYQLFAYLKSVSQVPDAPAHSGLLLYPAIGETLDEKGIMQGHPIQFATVDLTLPSLQIREQLARTLTEALGLDATKAVQASV